MTPSEDIAGASPKLMRLRYAGACETCGTALDAGSRAVYLKATRAVQCLVCPEPTATATGSPAADLAAAAEPAVESGTAGSSARREYERRSAKRETRIREAHPRLGGLILAVSDEPQSTTAWARGARGEELLGATLDALATRGVRLLHDRRIPRTRANIDHIAVGPTGVHVIDAKRYKGRPNLRAEGGLIRPRVHKLAVGSRDCTGLVDGIHKQVALVRAALDAADRPDTPVHAALCFVDADWPLFGGSFLISDVAVLWPRKLVERVIAPGAMTGEQIEAVHRSLARAFPAA
ncbi:nuclease-related domain-containing protein [Cellulomonas sp. S1-8]|uniref:nuclease-related domain-containing protein n=1 Tax=Cellulomonas sp. S1-8 TaxID=2904790 RepID=UPI002244A564|nr:nuclease-related domain-containing protein [Cellulomonas sp. S1-8]UZN04214.1 NERD domain-containing protein [Cellulomonas sp. S1-8]